ncbi:MAG: hypothetical protein H7101_12690 [Deinococcales bacterium]|nr:hypothetical protein [Chitinophagaceae bacterium]
MIKKTFTLFTIACLLFVGSQVNAQTTLIIDGASKSAVSTQINADDDDITDALHSYFKKMGSNLKKSDGFYIVKNVQLPQLSTEKLDMYFKIEQLGSNKNSLSNVSLAVKPTKDIFVGDSSHKEIYTLLPQYLQGFDPIVKEFIKQRTIDALNKDAAKATEKQMKLEKRAAKKGAEAKKLDKKAKEVN